MNIPNLSGSGVNLPGSGGGLTAIRDRAASFQQQEPNAFGINPRDKKYAAKTEAALLRSNWDRARATLTPLVDRLTALYTNPQGREEAVQESRGLASSAFSRSLDTAERENQSLGIQLTPDQKASYGRQANAIGGLSDVDAANRGSRGYDDLKQRIALGG